MTIKKAFIPVTLLCLMLQALPGCNSPEQGLHESEAVISLNDEPQPAEPEPSVVRVGSNQPETERMEQHIEKLTANGPRPVGSESEKAAARYLQEQMEAYAYRTHVQAFTFKPKPARADRAENAAPPPAEIRTGYNVIADMNNNSETDRVLVLCAHYDTTSDHLGYIDNTSGVVTLLEAARLLADKALPFDLRFIFFSAEERSFKGSEHYTNSLTAEETDDIIACINVDVVGYCNGGEPVLNTVYSSYNINDASNYTPEEGVPNSLTAEWQRISPQQGTQVQHCASSDHVSFEAISISNMMISQPIPDYLHHLNTDTQFESDIESLSLPELVKTIDMIVQYVENLDIANVGYENIPPYPE